LNEINKLPYAQWLEESLRNIIGKDVQAICILAKYTDPEDDPADNLGPIVESGYWNCCMVDKMTFAGFLQQDAMLDTMRANGYISDDESEEEEAAYG
jgi:hypothetical protein